MSEMENFNISYSESSMKIKTAMISPNSTPAKNLSKEAIAEIESLGSTSELEDFSLETEKIIDQEADERNLQIIKEPEKFLQYEMCSDEESSFEEEQYNYDKELEYFEIFENVPQLDDISTDSTDDLIVNKSVNVEDEASSSDMGKFVNPLTGVSSISSSLSQKSKENKDHYRNEESVTDSDERERQQSQVYKSVSLNEDFMEKDIEETKDSLEDIVKQEVDTFQQFLEIQKEEDPTALESDQKINLIIQEQEHLLQENTLEFLNNLIDRCVAKAEYIDDNIILRKNLNKMKLLKDFKAKWEYFESEKRAVQFLNRKCIEYFKRKSVFRLTTPDDLKTLKTDHKRYCNVLKDLDKLLIRKENMKNHYDSQVLNLKDQFKTKKREAHEEIDNLEELIKQTFHHDQFTRLENSVGNGLSKMAAIRKEISNVRFRLLLKQHEISSLRKQMKNINDLGNNLQVTQYENLEAEANTLSQKIEERNIALDKLHEHYNSDVHNMAHLKERQKMIRHTIMIQKQYFQELKNEEKNIRKYISQLGLKHKNLRLEIRNLSFQSGLLDKPALMKDYDETVETVINKELTIEGLKANIERLTEKIFVMENLNRSISS